MDGSVSLQMSTRSVTTNEPRTPDEIAEVLTTFVNNSIMARGHPVQSDDDLEVAGVDSMALLRIFLFIEAEFGFWMPDEDLVRENIGSTRALANYIRSRSGGTASLRG
jgi:acyl carrier protein